MHEQNRENDHARTLVQLNPDLRSSVIRIVITPDLMLDATTVSQLYNGTSSAARRWPGYHAGVMNAAPSHSFGEYSRETWKECCLASAWQTSCLPTRLTTRFALHLMLEMPAITVVVHEVYVEPVHRAMTGRVDNKSATCTAAPRVSGSHATVVVANITPVNAFNARAAAPHLITSLVPTTSALKHKKLC